MSKKMHFKSHFKIYFWEDSILFLYDSTVYYVFAPLNMTWAYLKIDFERMFDETFL